MMHAWRGLRFLQLFAFVVLLLFLLPLQVRHHLVVVVAQVLILNAILVALSSSRGSTMRRLLIGGWTLNILLQAAAVFRPTGPVLLVAEAAGTAVLAVSAGVILAFVFRNREITIDTFFAAIVAYMFVALVFGRVYGILETVTPASFDLREGADPGTELLYFSFVTIATLGYGDVVPRLPLVQMLAVMEAITGQFFVAVIIAWLVSVHAAARRPT